MVCSQHTHLYMISVLFQTFSPSLGFTSPENKLWLQVRHEPQLATVNDLPLGTTAVHFSSSGMSTSNEETFIYLLNLSTFCQKHEIWVLPTNSWRSKILILTANLQNSVNLLKTSITDSSHRMSDFLHFGPVNYAITTSHGHHPMHILSALYGTRQDMEFVFNKSQLSD